MTQWLSKEELRACQASRVSELLLHARKTTDFYKNRLDVDLGSPAGIEKTWSDIPILTRADALKHRSKLMSRKTPRASGPVIEGRTSGSTGTPFKYKTSAASLVVARALTERMLRWWSVDGNKSFAQIAGDSKGVAPPPEGRTTYGWHSSHPEGVRHFLDVKTDVERQLKWLLARRPVYFGTYPPILKELALIAQKSAIELKFDLLTPFGTVVDDETRELCRAAFGADIADTYGTQEAGHIAVQCSACGEYHISAEAGVIEVLDIEGSPAGPGEIGRVVVTPLYNFAMPLIRYELGDMAEVGSAQPSCGRGLPTLRRILGRTRNLFRFRDGSTMWPKSGAFRLGDFIALKRFQVVQTDLDHVEIRYERGEIDRPIDLPALTERMTKVLHHPVTVVVRAVDKIDRSASGKYEECLSLVAPDWQDSAPAETS
jgi:phenylacetate-CoA ligase